MDIVNQIYNSIYKPREERVSSGNRVQNRPVDGRSLSLAALNPGDVFEGEVTDVKNQEVTIHLSGNETITARLGDSVPLNIGDTMLFQVKENTGEQLFIKPMPNQEMNQMSAIAERALTANGFSLSEKNGMIAMALMEAGEPLDKANIMRLMQQSYKFQDADLHTLVALNKMNIPVTEGNINQLTSYMENTHQMAAHMQQMAGTAVEGFMTMLDDADIPSLLVLNDTFLEVFGIGEENQAVSAETEDFLRNFAMTTEAEIPEFTLDGQGTSGSSDAKTADRTDAVQQDASGLTAFPEEHAALETSQHAHAGEGISQGLENPNLTLTFDQTLQMVEILNREGFDLKETMMMFRQAETPAELLHQLSSQLANMTEDGMRKLLKADGYGELLTDALKRAWSIDPKKMKEPKELDDLYEKMQRDAQKLETAFQDKEAGQSFREQHQEMKEQLKFMQDLNQNFVYSQFMMQSGTEMNNSELFVYADKKKLQAKREDISVLLHLDMDHLGPTDVHVTLTHQNVHAVFYLPDQKACKVVADNMGELRAKLSEKGLTLTDDVVKRPEVKKSPVVEEILDPDMEKSVKRYNFDVRG